MIRRALRARFLLPIASLGITTWIVWWSVVNGRREQRLHRGLFLGAAPLVGRNEKDGWDWRFNWSLIGAGALALVVVVACWRDWWTVLRLRWVIIASALGATAFAVLLGLTDGLDGLTHGAADKSEYLANLAKTPPAGEFVRRFLRDLNGYSVHVRGHPPGFVLVLKLLDNIGLRGVWPVVTLSIGGCGVLTAAVLLTVRTIAGDEWMRRAAPFLIVAPYSIWMVTSGDSVFTAIGAVGVLAAAEGLRRTGRIALLLGLASGLLLGFLLFLTYLGAIYLLLPTVIVVVAVISHRRGAIPAIVGAVIAGLAVLIGFRLAGFWWFDGVDNTRQQYLLGTAQFRKWSYFRFGNIGAALIVIGPVGVIGLATLRNRRLWLLIGAACAGLLISHFSQYTKAEVERIWLLFYPWIAIAAAGLFVARRKWLMPTMVAAQAVFAILLQAALVSKW